VFGQNGFSPMGAQALQMAPMTPHRQMGQVGSSAAWWPTEGLTTAQAWDALLARAAKLSDGPAKTEILQWVGRSDIPGSPAERYRIIVDNLNANFSPSTEEEVTTLRNRLDLLKFYTGDLEAKVKNAEESGAPAAPSGAASTTERDRMMECVAGSIALIGLIILPLILD
jgi:hypothetical protein